MACNSTLDEVPGDLDLYVNLNIEMAIVLLQWISFAAMPSRTLNRIYISIYCSVRDKFIALIIEISLLVVG